MRKPFLKVLEALARDGKHVMPHLTVALFRSGALYLRFVGTHAEYAHIDVKEV